MAKRKMTPADRIAKEFERLSPLGRDGMKSCTFGERMVFDVVSIRCGIDIDGFASAYQQDLTAADLAAFVDGLNRIEEHELAGAFQRGYDLLAKEKFYEDLDWGKVSDSTVAEIESIGETVDGHVPDHPKPRHPAHTDMSSAPTAKRLPTRRTN